MATTTLFVEILVIGFMAEIWISLMIGRLMSGLTFESLTGLLRYLNDSSAVFALPWLAITYVIGWIVNFWGERLFKLVFQQRLRDRKFDGSGVSYPAARARVALDGSTRVFEEIRLDRHLIRISRGSALNFLLIGLGLGLYCDYRLAAAALVCVILAAASLYQCTKRYDSSSENILRWYNEIVRKEGADRTGSGG